MKENTNEYLGALGVLTTQESNGDINSNNTINLGILITLIGIILLISAIDFNNEKLISYGAAMILSGVVGTFIISKLEKNKNATIKIAKLKEKYDNDEDFSDIIANL